MAHPENSSRSGTSPSASGGQSGTPADVEGAATTRSPWLPVVLKIAGIAALLSGLAAIGAVSMVMGNEGVAVARGAAPLAESAWVGSDPRAPASAPSGARGGSARGDAERPRGPSPGVTADGKVILNLAEVDDLRRLPGIGRRRAEAILELRGRLKRFRRVTDLLRVRGLGVRAVRRLTPLVVVDAPKQETGADAGATADAAAPDAGR